MAFMEKEICFGEWIEIDGDGVDFIPADLIDTSDLEHYFSQGD